MRHIITAALAAAFLVPAAAGARSYGEVRRDRREVQQDRRDLNHARRDGDRGDVRDARQELREDRQETREDRRDFRDTHGNYRGTNGNAYRRPAYYGPRGYSYRPVTIGYRFAPDYYGRRYWVNDYANYRLRAPVGYQRWVRYGNDVVLVNIRNGRVIAVNNSFFR